MRESETPELGPEDFGKHLRQLRVASNQRRDTNDQISQGSMASAVDRPVSFIKQVEGGRNTKLSRAMCNKLEKHMGVPRDDIWEMLIKCKVDREVLEYLRKPPNWRVPDDIRENEAALFAIVRRFEVGLQAATDRPEVLDDVGFSVAGSLARLVDACVMEDFDEVRAADVGHAIQPARAFGNVVAMVHDLPPTVLQRAVMSLEQTLRTAYEGAEFGYAEAKALMEPKGDPKSQ